MTFDLEELKQVQRCSTQLLLVDCQDLTKELHRELLQSSNFDQVHLLDRKLNQIFDLITLPFLALKHRQLESINDLKVSVLVVVLGYVLLFFSCDHLAVSLIVLRPIHNRLLAVGDE